MAKEIEIDKEKISVTDSEYGLLKCLLLLKDSIEKLNNNLRGMKK